MKLNELDASAILRKAGEGGADFTEVFAEHRSSTSVIMEDSKIDRMSAGYDAGVGIRTVLRAS